MGKILNFFELED